MFAVQGWSVPAKGLVQEQAKRSSSTTVPAEAGSESNKRKRADQNAERSRKIDGSELERLWNQRFGESKTGKAHSKADRKQKRKENGGAESAVPSQLETGVSSEARDQQQKQKRHLESPRQVKPASKPSKPVRETDDHNPSSEAGDSRRKPSKLDKKQKKHKDGQHERGHTIVDAVAAADSIATMLPPPPPPATNLTPLQAKMRSKLTSARFRHLNETLYTTPSATALSLFATSPSLFAEYHSGFSQQVSSSWPRNPVDDFIASIKTRGPLSNSNNPLPRRKTQSCTIADLGCGDAPLARALIPAFTKKLTLTIHSYDLHAPNKHVTVADIAHLPLRDGEADLALFCLSLMGTNWIDFVEEAWRVLRGDGKGEVWVAEVKSRFGRGGDGSSGYRKSGEAVNHSVGKQRKLPPPPAKRGKNKKAASTGDDDGDEADLPEDLFTSESAATTHAETDTPDLRPFIDVWTRRGFQLKPESVDASNKMFVSMTFFKSGIPTAGRHKGMKWNGKQYERMGKADENGAADREVEGKVLKPCVYKTR